MVQTFSREGFILFNNIEKKDFLDALKEYFPSDVAKLESFDIMINKVSREYLLLRDDHVCFRMTFHNDGILYQMQ